MARTPTRRTGPAWPRRAAAAVEGWDVLLTAAAATLFVGLVLVFDVGIALVTIGTLGVVGAIAGARGADAAKTAPPEGRR